MKTTLLIDGDEYLFKACAAVEREVRWDEWNHVLFASRPEAWGNFERMIGELSERFAPAISVLCFSGKQPYFRHALAPDYKPGRSRKPLCYTELREQCETAYVVQAFDGLEADDIMGILATKPGQGKRIIVSQDKDMKTVPGYLLREGEVIWVNEGAADYWHMYQTLVGDPTDGFKGCPGVGPVKATQLLDDTNWTAPYVEGTGLSWPQALWSVVVAEYQRRGFTEEDALLQARMARILRWSDWDSTKKRPILWHPSGR